MSGLLGDFLRSEKQRGLFDEEYQRGGLVPLAINPFTGRAEMAMPQFLGGLLEAFKAPGDVLAGRKAPTIEDALNVAGAVSLGSFPMARAAFQGAVYKGLFGGADDAVSMTNASKNASIFPPPQRPARPIADDYKSGIPADSSGRLTHDIDGRPIEAKWIAGRRTVSGADEAIPAAELDALAEAIIGRRHEVVHPTSLGTDLGRFRGEYDPSGRLVRRIRLRDGLSPETSRHVLGHEVGHALTDFSDPIAAVGFSHERVNKALGQVYHDLNDASWRRGQPTRPGLQTKPEDFGYVGRKVPPEYTAEAVRAYLENPNYLKSVSPEVAKRIRAMVNSDPRLNKIIQFNASGLPIGLGQPTE